jgi:hypothetical protein
MRDPSVIEAAYAGSGGKAAAGYTKGIQGNTNWFAQASSDVSESNWQIGVTAAASEKRRAAGLRNKSSQALWQAAAQAKGATIIGSRIQAAAPKQAAAWKPYYDALTALTIPDKTPNDPLGNLSRNAGRVVATLVNVKRAKEGVPPIAVP